MSFAYGTRRTRGVVAAMLGLALITAACGGGSAAPAPAPAPASAPAPAPAAEPDPLEGFPPREMTLIIPATAGGGSDNNARAIGPHFERIVGARLVMENHPGAGNTIGAQIALQRPQDCTTMFIVNVPHILFGYLTQQVDFTYDDWAPLAQVSVDPGVIRVRNDAPWQTLTDLIEDARANPGRIRASISNVNNNNYIGIVEIAEAAGVEFNIVPFEGGPEARLAVIGGQVDFTHAGVFNSLAAAEDTRVIAVHNEVNLWPDLTDNAGTVADQLGVAVQPNWSSSGFYVPAGCRDDYPERYEFLADKMLEILADEQFLDAMDALGEKEKLQPLGPADFDARIRALLVDVERTVAENS